MQTRQGDVILVSVSTATVNLGEPVRATKGDIVLAWGESTGHRHRFTDGAILYVTPHGRYVEVLQTATTIVHVRSVEQLRRDEIRVRDLDETTIRMDARRLAEIETAIREATALTYAGSLLRHEEHDAIIVAPGLYRLPSQRQYTGPRFEPVRVSD